VHGWPARAVVLAAASIASGALPSCGLSGTGLDDLAGADAGPVQNASSDASGLVDARAPIEGSVSAPDSGRPADDGGTKSASEGGGDDDADADVDSSTVVSPVDASPSDDAAPPDAAGPFGNLVQIAGTPFNANTVATTATGGVALTSMDGHVAANDGNDLGTQSKVSALGGVAGLPDTGSFAGNGATIPPLQFAWNNSTNNLNGLIVAGGSPTAYAFNVPAGKAAGYYGTVQLYGTGTNGTQTLDYTLTYATGAATLGSMTVPDWCATTPLPASTYKLSSTNRVRDDETGLSDSNGALCSVYALSIAADSGRVLTQFSFTNPSSPPGDLVLFGLAVW
jgi:hypothetical protein